MKSAMTLMGLLLTWGCGLTVRDGGAQAGDNAAGGDSASPPGVGPINASEQPSSLPMTCAGREALAFKLPCLVGMNITGHTDEPGYHVVECQLAGQPDQTAVSFIISLPQLPALLNEPVSIPFANVPPAPPGLGVPLDGENFAGTLSGVATFTQVDVDGRAFVARLEQGHVTWNGSRGGNFACNTIDGTFWAVAGWFV